MWEDLPELARIEDADERAGILSIVNDRLGSGRLWRYLLIHIAGTALVLIAINSAFLFLLRLRVNVSWRPSLLGLNLIAGPAGTVIAQLCIYHYYRRRAQRYLREQLVQRGIPICITCGYDLRGLADARCPECGVSFDKALLKPGTTDEPRPAKREGCD